MNKIIIFGVIGLIATSFADLAQDTKDTRKVRLVGPITQPPNSNSLGSSQDGVFKPITSPAGIKPTTAPLLHEHSATQPSRQQDPIYGQTHPQTGTSSANTNQNGQYIIGVNPQLLPGQGPVLMQYLSPQGQPQGALQYFQILRPFVYPVLPQPYLPSQIPTQIAPQLPPGQAGAGRAVNQHHAHPHPHVHVAPQQQQQPQQQPSITTYHPQQHLLPGGGQHFAQTQTTPQQSFGQPSTVPQQGYVQPGAGVTAGPAYNAYQQPIASYSHPSVSYYQPQNSRLQLVNPPKDLSLNTNEYMPSASEVNFKAVKPQPPVQRA